jgi:hypothetical protein
MSSQVEIVNNALVEIGEATIASITQGTRAARAANRVWDNVRRGMLTRYRWNFAKRRAVLAPDVDTPAFGYINQFTPPDDFLQLIGIYDSAEDQRQLTTTRQAYSFENNKILWDGTALYIFYTANVTDTNTFDPAFEDALVYKLAMRLAYDLSTGTGRIEDLNAKFSESIRTAKFQNAIQNSPEVIQASDWVDSREYSRGPYRAGPILL